MDRSTASDGGEGAGTQASVAERREEAMSRTISRRAYAEMYGPTVGDRVRLADTRSPSRSSGTTRCTAEEVKFGGGRIIRDGMGQSQAG